MADQTTVNDTFEDAPTLAAIIVVLSSYRRFIFTCVAATFMVTLCVSLIVYFRAPTEQVGSIGFRLTFDGAEKGRFANGATFSPAEIASTGVLAEVYEANDFQQYGSLEDLQRTTFVLQANPELDVLGMEYESKLSDTKITSVERSRVEEEFQRKREGATAPMYSVNFRRRTRGSRVPASLVAKLLQDTLSVWARHADERKGVNRFDLAVLSKNALRDGSWASEDPAIGADILRNTVEETLATVDQLAALPGAGAMRIGPEQRSLGDIRLHLRDLVSFKIEPLIGLIRSSAISGEPRGAERYFQGRAFEVRLGRDEAVGRMKILQDSLRAYQSRGSTDATVSAEGRGESVRPQLSESFFDRLVELSSDPQDIEFRQDLTKRIISEGIAVSLLDRQASYYEAMGRAFPPAFRAAGGKVDLDVKRRMAEIYKELQIATVHVEELYKQISRQILSPDLVLYSITAPFAERSTSSMPVRAVGVYVLIALVAGAIVAALTALAHAYILRAFSISAGGAGSEAAH